MHSILELLLVIAYSILSQNLFKNAYNLVTEKPKFDCSSLKKPTLKGSLAGSVS